MAHVAVVIVLTLIVICGSQGRVWFSRDGECVAPAPCSCDNAEVLCSSRQLRAMPTFTPRDVSNDSLAGGPMSAAFFQMYSNNIEIIGDHAFCNLTFAISTRVFLMLASNSISSFTNNAFDCIQNNVHYLDLQNNRLTELPNAMLKLRNLTELFLQNNPLLKLNPLIMRQLGPTLTNLQLDMDRFSTWPSALKHLRVLYYLRANNITFSIIPEDGFSGFESSLNGVQFDNSQLKSLPGSLCRMARLRYVRVESFEQIDIKHIVPCVKKIEIAVNETNGLLTYDIKTRNWSP